MGRVNIDYALGIVQKNNRLEIVKEEISSSSLLLSELQDMINNDNKTIMDMQNHYNLNINTIQKSFGYILPDWYSSSFVNGVREPQISYTDFQKLLDERISKTSASTYEERKKIANRLMKQDRYNSYVRFLKCYNYFLACKKIRENYDWKMISSESIGWTGYEYPIDEDFVVYVSTNFGYGWSSYFNLTVKYKDIIIAPYTYLIKYYRANMVQICNCTRAYTVERENWEVAFDFVKDFVNHGKESPVSFAKKYILNEVNELINGMVRIMQAPESEVQQKINDIGRYSNDFRNLTCISDMPNEDKEYFEMNRKEFGVVYKSEKISCGLDVLESLKTLLPILPEVEISIEKIKSLNHLLIPEITTLTNSIEKEIDSLKNEIETYKGKKSMLEKKKEPYDTLYSEEWNVIYKKDPSNSSGSQFSNDFKKRHPEYSDLAQEINELYQKINEADRKKTKRAILKERLEDCLKKINDYFAKAA